MTVYSPSQDYLSGRSPDYPDSNVFTVLGPVLLPKIYGSNLSALEIASSGTIVLSLADVESITLSNDTVNKITTYRSIHSTLKPNSIYNYPLALSLFELRNKSVMMMTM